MISDDSPEAALILFIVEGGLILLDKGIEYYRDAGLDVGQLDLLVR